MLPLSSVLEFGLHCILRVSTAVVMTAVVNGPLTVTAEELWVAKGLTPENSFTTGIEGPNSDAVGNVYVVNYKERGDIARVTPEGQAEVFVTLPDGPADAKGKVKRSTGNGIVFDAAEKLYVADYVNHNVLRIDPATKKIEVFAHDDRFSQPNDLAIAPNDVIYASDPDWGKKTGKIVMVDRRGKTTIVAEGLGTTNGIEVSPDGKTLYVNESVQRGIWSFPIHADGTLGERKLFKQFDDHGFDGMRCDAAGRLYVTRYGEGMVVVLSTAGEIVRKIDVLGKSPSNVCFGGPDGRTVFVTEVEKKRLVAFRSDTPGANRARRQK
jgi:sugar lactone lactonase YvrE